MPATAQDAAPSASAASPEATLAHDLSFVLKAYASLHLTRSQASQRRDQGPLTRAGPRAWMLNPKSPLPLTLLGAETRAAQRVKDLLDEPEYRTRKVPRLALLIAEHGLRFKELDDWVAELKPRVVKDLARRIQSSSEWAEASKKERLDLRAEFEEEALQTLGLPRGCADWATLLLGQPQGYKTDDAVLRRFKGDSELYTFYLTQLARVNPVATAKANDWGRKSWERLVAIGLALRGKDIALPMLLEGLRLKDLHAILGDTVDEPLDRKAKAVQAALALPDLVSRLAQHLSFREMFQAIPPRGVELGALGASFGYATQVALAVTQTYDTASRTLDGLSRQTENPLLYEGWEIINWKDPLPACAQAHCRQHEGTPPKFPPFHIGCNCEMRALYAWKPLAL